MPEVRRIFVEKKPGFDVEAKHILQDLKDSLGLEKLESLRILNRYDVQGISEADFSRASNTIFSEPNQDNIYLEEFSVESDWKIFATEYLPGQYDQRADSAAQCVQLLTAGEMPKVISAKVIAVKGEISENDFSRIKSYLVNPVESRIASMSKPETLDMTLVQPDDILRVQGFITWSDEEVANYHASVGFAMSVEDLCFCRNYFANEEKREPSVTELKVIDTYWSDHCRHTTFLTKLDEISFEEGKITFALEDALKEYIAVRDELYVGKDKDVCLMDMACIGAKYLKNKGLVNDLDVSEEINACSIEVPVTIDGKTEQWLVQFKNETHNHPTEIEPFGGAATCLGGAIRDPLSGRSYVYQAMRVTGSGDPRVAFKDTMPGKLSQKKITTGAASGYSSYGNQIGLATGQVTELYDEGYVAKRLEIGAVVGASPKENVVREVPAPGDIIVLLGGRTGRDGCGGATGSSKAHDSSSIENCGAEVQKGNPPTERKIQRLFRNPVVSKMIKRCNDFGAGGVCVAIGELADGLEIDLNAVPKKYDGLGGTELAISESQERMAVVLDKKDVQAFIDATADENLEATVVAVVTESPRLCMQWRDDKIVDLSREFLNTNGVTQHAVAKITAVDPEKNYRTSVPESLKDKSVEDAFVANLSRLEVCSQKGLVERFDSSIGAATVLMPFAGKYQLTPEEIMCAKIPVLKGETDDATAMSYGFIPGISRWSPFHGAVYAVTECLAKIAAAGADPFKTRLTMQEYFERLKDVPERWGKPVSALLGGLLAQLKFEVPSIGGKDSMSGSFNDLDVPPTLVCFAVGMTKATQTVSATLKSKNSKLYMIKLPVNEESMLPDWDKAKQLFTFVYENVKDGKILSATTVREGGSAGCVSRMAFGNKIGVEFENGLDTQTLFAPLAGSFVVEVEGELSNSAFDITLLAKTNDSDKFTINGKDLDINELVEVWEKELEPVFANNIKAKPDMSTEVELFTQRNTSAPAIKVAKPKVFIPAFPGTNCEVDTARAFEKAGADAQILIVKNLTSKDIEETIERMEKMIRESQIVMLPGGFSGGDEPDGSGKFIATTFRNERIKDAVTDLLENRDGLMLGICNGFQALIKLGLVPYGKIVDTKPTDPTLTFNTIARHVSRMCYTRVSSVKSPWLAGVNAGDMHAVPVSHGEGRFVADENTMKQLIANGQIATQYVDEFGVPSADIHWNPNGSISAVEGITSPDGRVFGKMGHSERKGDSLYMNVPNEKDQKIFESGVKYFK